MIHEYELIKQHRHPSLTLPKPSATSTARYNQNGLFAVSASWRTQTAIHDLGFSHGLGQFYLLLTLSISEKSGKSAKDYVFSISKIISSRIRNFCGLPVTVIGSESLNRI